MHDLETSLPSLPCCMPSSSVISSLDIRVGDCRELLREMPDESVQCCVTSPPYWGLRDYGDDGKKASAWRRCILGITSSYGTAQTDSESMQRLIAVVISVLFWVFFGVSKINQKKLK